MNARGWLIAVVLIAGAFLPTLGARTPRVRRALLVLGLIAAAAIAATAVAAALDTSEGFFPSGWGFVFILLTVPLGVGLWASGIVLLASKHTSLGTGWRVALSVIGVFTPFVVMWLSFR